MHNTGMSSEIYKAISILREGGIVIFPTDTAFGVGCRVDMEDSVQRLFAMRNRPVTKATPVLVDSQKTAMRYFLSPSPTAQKLMDTYWPGALTIVAPCHTERICPLARGGGVTVGLRMPDHPVPLELIRGVGIPILGPSANFSGDPTPHEFSHIHPDFLSLADYVIPGVCRERKASTVVDCSVEPYTILRQGALELPKNT